MRRGSRSIGIGVALAGMAAGLAGAPDAAQTGAGDLVDRSALRVCADPNNLPYSNQAGEGFENRIAELFASDLGVPVTYTWYPDTTGFVRNTLNAGECDLIMATTSASELLQNTNPYYTSTYALVQQAGREPQIESLSDPALKDRTIGAVARTPPVTVLAQQGLLRNMKWYHLMVDTRHYAPARDLVQDAASGKVDVGVLWGPLAGYWAERQDVRMRVVPLTSGRGEVPMSFRISMGVRHGENDWKRQVNELIAAHQDEINAILREYSVPLLDRQGRVIAEAPPPGGGGSAAQ